MNDVAVLKFISTEY